MKMKLWFSALLLVAGLALVAQEKPYVIAADGAKHEGDSIAADANGNLKLKAGVATKTFPARSYRRAWVPKPRPVVQAEKLYEAGKYDEANRLLGPAFGQYKFLGWGATIAELRGKAALADNNAREAEIQFKNGLPFAQTKSEQVMLRVGMARAMIEQNRLDDARKLVDAMATVDPELAPKVYHVKGYLQEKSGEQKQAVLEYLKVVLIYEDAGEERKLALQNVVRILRDMKDNHRATEFEELLQQYN